MQLQNLTTKFLGKNFYYVDTIDSTQLEIWRKIEKENIEDGAVVLAEIQTLGMRNTW